MRDASNYDKPAPRAHPQRSQWRAHRPGGLITARRRLAFVILAAAGVLAALPSAGAAQPPVLMPPVSVAGPNPDIDALSGMAIARDGTGGLVYLETVSGVAHAFVSRLIGGSFQPPLQVDASLSGTPSSQPVIAAGNGGVLLVAFINSGQLYTVDSAGASAPLGPPALLSSGASNPALQMTNFGKAYLAFSAADGAGDDVRPAYYYQGQWALESAPLNVAPADDAGTGAGRPAVAAAGDGVAIVAWGESGHIYSRRVWGTSPSVVYEQADAPSLSGWQEVSAGEPAVAAGGDSSYADVVFHEVLSNGSVQQSRVLMNRLQGSQYNGANEADGLSTPGADGADQPKVAEGEYGSGLATSARQDSDQVYATLLGGNGTNVGTVRVDSLPNVTAPDPSPAISGLFSGLIAWQHDPGPSGMPEIRARWWSGSSLGPEFIVSSPTFGRTDAADGLFGAGDVAGDQAIAWVQGSGSSTRVLAAQLYAGPGSFAALTSFQYVRGTQPVLAWSPTPERWGPVDYVVRVDGAQIGTTTATSTPVPAPLSQGPHTWHVSAVNVAGLVSTIRAATVFVDTLPPVAQFTLTGTERASSVVHIYVSYTDAQVPEPPADSSGVASVTVKWGDGTSYQIRHGKFHIYKRPGRYLITVIVEDRAGNTTKVVRTVTIAATPRAVGKPRHTAPKGHR